MASQSSNTVKYEFNRSFDDHYTLVKEFHYMFEHPINDEEQVNIITDNSKLVEFRYKLIDEEVKEFGEAYEEHDIGEMADALCDISYVVNGAGLCFGIDMSKIYNTFCAKPSNFINHTYIKMFTKNKEYLDTEYMKLQENLRDYLLAVETNNFDNLKMTLFDIQKNVYTFGYSLGFDMDLMFREVHESNMTKLCSNETDAQDSVSKYKDDDRYDIVSYRKKNGYFIVFNQSNGKILKNHKWRLPNLKQFMKFLLVEHNCDEDYTHDKINKVSVLNKSPTSPKTIKLT
jgi:predicted HAD superfamily Cof-like phosphohydrolase